MLTKSLFTLESPKDVKLMTPTGHPGPDPKQIAQQWIWNLESVLATENIPLLEGLMHRDCQWRDMLAFDWDFHTINGLDKLSMYMNKNIGKTQPSHFRLHQSGNFTPSIAKPSDGLAWIQSMFDFETKTGRGSGMLRIAQGIDGIWKGHMMYTVLKELRDSEEQTGHRRQHGGNNSLLGGAMKGNWLDRRQRQLDFLDEDPEVLVIGAGQAGLNLAARLQAMGMSCLIVDKNSRIGDNWRHRYRVSCSPFFVIQRWRLT